MDKNDIRFKPLRNSFGIFVDIIVSPQCVVNVEVTHNILQTAALNQDCLGGLYILVTSEIRNFHSRDVDVRFRADRGS